MLTCWLHFCICAQAFAAISDRVREDPYLHKHLRYYVREVRVVAYSQVRRGSYPSRCEHPPRACTPVVATFAAAVAARYQHCQLPAVDKDLPAILYHATSKSRH